MNQYIVLLRGINVGGHRKILMTDLRSLLANLGCSEVTTYIQSGNVVFAYDKKTSQKALEQTIKQAILEQYGFDVPVLIRTGEEWKSTIVANPFLKEETGTLYITFLAETPDETAVEELTATDYSPDCIAVLGKNVFLYIAEKYGKSKLSNPFLERKLKVSATTRNWKTTLKMMKLLEKK